MKKRGALGDVMELSLPSELGYELVARDAVAALAHRLGFSAERVEDLKSALSEACMNAIEHGNSLQAGLRVRVFCSVDESRLAIDVVDEGVHIPNAHEPATIEAKIVGMASPRGMGLMLIRALSDEAGFVGETGHGNRFRLTFHRP